MPTPVDDSRHRRDPEASGLLEIRSARIAAVTELLSRDTEARFARMLEDNPTARRFYELQYEFALEAMPFDTPPGAESGYSDTGKVIGLRDGLRTSSDAAVATIARIVGGQLYLDRKIFDEIFERRVKLFVDAAPERAVGLPRTEALYQSYSGLRSYRNSALRAAVIRNEGRDLDDESMIYEVRSEVAYVLGGRQHLYPKELAIYEKMVEYKQSMAEVIQPVLPIFAAEAYGQRSAIEHPEGRRAFRELCEGVADWYFGSC